MASNKQALRGLQSSPSIRLGQPLVSCRERGPQDGHASREVHYDNIAHIEDGAAAAPRDKFMLGSGRRLQPAFPSTSKVQTRGSF